MIKKLYSPITLADGVTAYGGQYAVPQSITYMNGDGAGASLYLHVKVEGLVKFTGELKASTKIGQLDLNIAPKKTMAFVCATSGGFVRIQINNAGEIVMREGTAKDHIYLDGINFDHDPYQ